MFLYLLGYRGFVYIIYMYTKGYTLKKIIVKILTLYEKFSLTLFKEYLEM